ncbi:MAG: porin [Gammaproteobacteria bacterium]
MAIQFKQTRLAAAVATAAVGLGLSAASHAVVVVGGDNGWEVSFDGNINAFYVQGNYDAGYNGLGLAAPNSATPGVANSGGNSTFAGNSLDASRITSGFLPAFFSFNVKSPTVNGMTGSARFSFAPQITNANTKNQIYGAAGGLNNGNSQGIQGSSIDTREVLVNLDGAFGTVSFGRTLSIFGRNAILKDMTLFGVGIANGQSGAVTAGRIGRGYTYPNFNARFSYKTPNFNGLQAEIGLYDPSIEQLNSAAGVLDETDTPRFEGELSYTTAFSGGSAQFWVDGLWQDIEGRGAAGLASSADVSVQAWGVGAEAKMAGFALTGYYYDGSGLGRSLQFVGGTACNGAAVVDANGVTFGAGSRCEATDNDGYYLQGTYTFNGKTKVGVSYGESTEDAFSDSIIRQANSANEMQMRDVELSMWTVGVYHDVNSWLKLIAEYSHSRNDFGQNQFTLANGQDTEADTFSVGSFFFW